MPAHFRLAPSSSDRWIPCSASAQDDLPNTESAASTQGSHAHGLGSEVLCGADVEFPDDEMRQGVFEYVGYVREFLSQHIEESRDRVELGFDPTKLYVENQFVSQLIPDHGGTLDALIVSPTVLHVIDFKYGIMPVAPEDNTQLMCYLNLAREYFPECTRFLASIVQPRVPGDPRCVEYTAGELDVFRSKVEQAGQSNELHAGGHCKWCPLRQTCTELETHTIKMAQDEFDDGWSIEKCQDVIEMGGVFANLVKDAKDHRLSLMLQGHELEGHRVAQSLGNRAWNTAEQAKLERELRKAGLKKKDWMETKLKSPTQIEAMDKALKAVVAKYCERADNGPVVVKAHSKLPEYQPENQFTDLSD